VYVYALIAIKNCTMDYSQFQVKYIDTPAYSGRLPEIQDSEEISLGNLSYLDGEAEPATALL
jgi:hypothetical protein